MKSTITKLITKDKQARMLVLDNTAIIRELINGQTLDLICAEALATTVTMSSLMGGLLKDDQRLNIQVHTSAPSEYIRCDVDSNGNVSGYTSDALTEHKDKRTSIPDMIGNRGFIRVTKDIGMGSMFTSTVDMPYQNIVDDFSHYFLQSDQIQTVFRYYYSTQNSKVSYSRGILFQPLPFAKADLLNQWTNWFDKNEEVFRRLSFDTNGKDMAELFSDASIVEQQTVQLFCGCSKEAFIGLLYGLGQKELKTAVKNKQEIEIICSICGKKYLYSDVDISHLTK